MNPIRSFEEIIRSAESAASAPPDEGKTIAIKSLNAYYGKHQALQEIDLEIRPGLITAIIGPSDCGKSTLIRCINRMHEVVKGAYATGSVFLDGEDVYAPSASAVRIRRRIGMVFQKPNPFPTRSIFENVIAGVRLNLPKMAKADYEDMVERSLRAVALWDEVKDKLHSSGSELSGGQQQRLCIARAIALEPEVLLLDEPCSALDPRSTLKIEDLLFELKSRYTIVLVTHNMQQAARASDMTAFMLADEDHVGGLIEFGQTRDIFIEPKDARTEEYISGRSG
jgi:phosphate transport system ATP-binding protein